jgi:hypothetical protein
MGDRTTISEKWGAALAAHNFGVTAEPGDCVFARSPGCEIEAPLFSGEPLEPMAAGPISCRRACKCSSKTWHLTARPTATASVVVRELNGNRLLAFGAVEDESSCRDAMTRWLMRKTR